MRRLAAVVILLITPGVSHPAQQKWVQVLEITGSATKQTDLFETRGAKWRVRWRKTNADESLSIYVYASDGGIIDVIATKKTLSDESYIHKAGTFYLKLNSSDSYNVIIEDWR